MAGRDPARYGRKTMRVAHISFVFSLALAMDLSAASAFAETLLRVHVVDNAGSSVHKAEVRVGTFKDRKGRDQGADPSP